ncbi:MAG: hypothetical protein JNM18_15380 [Planctomycetaceae bacterium]|nr:hypothetical protein [Planctomycetaceae bacterium]
MDGSLVLQQLQQTAAQLRSESSSRDNEAAQLDTRVNSLVAKQGAALLELAQHYLPDLERSTIQATFEGIRGELLDLLAKQESRQAELEQLTQRLQREIEAYNATLNEVTAQLNTLVGRREQLEPVVAAQLQQRPEFVELSQRAAQAEIGLQQNEARVHELQDSAREKLPAYEQSQLFQYLYRRKFGTPDYASSGIIRWLDGWVARLIDYPQARRGYEFLRRTPEVLQAELAKRQQDFHALMRQIEAIELEVATAAGLTAVRTEGEERGRQREQIVAQIASHTAELAKLAAERQQLASAQNEFYQQALVRFQRFLGETRATVLATRAQQTPEPKDDQLVAALVTINTDIDDTRRQIESLAVARQTLSTQVAGLDTLVTRFRQQNFDSDRSYFDPTLSLDGALQQFLGGLLTLDSLWQLLHSRQHFRQSAATTAINVAGQVLASPASRALAEAMIQAAGHALGSAAGQGYSRRASHRHTELPSSSSRSSSSSGGFTTGDGF